MCDEIEVSVVVQKNQLRLFGDRRNEQVWEFDGSMRRPACQFTLNVERALPVLVVCFHVLEQ